MPIEDMPEPLEAPIEDSGHPCFHVDNCLLRPYSCFEWDVRAASQWLISSDVQPESLHSVDHPSPTLSVSTFQAAPGGGGWPCLDPH